MKISALKDLEYSVYDSKNKNESNNFNFNLLIFCLCLGFCTAAPTQKHADSRHETEAKFQTGNHHSGLFGLCRTRCRASVGCGIVSHGAFPNPRQQLRALFIVSVYDRLPCRLDIYTQLV